jgi:hypothetical protein
MALVLERNFVRTWEYISSKYNILSSEMRRTEGNEFVVTSR